MRNAANYDIQGLPEDYETPEEYLASEEVHNSNKQVGVGIVIENYSKYNLKFPTLNFENKGREFITKVADVNAKSSAIFILDNHRWAHYGIHGAIAWQLMQSGSVAEDPRTPRRLIIGFGIPYRLVKYLEFKSIYNREHSKPFVCFPMI